MRLALRFTRYTAGSVVALATSELVLIATYGTGLLGTTPASVLAFFAGAVPNYVLNRSWVWQRRGRLDVRRELLPYLLVSLVSLVAGALATGWAAGLAPDGDTVRSAFVAGAYLATYGLLFVLKFVAYHYLVFTERKGPPHTSLISGAHDHPQWNER